MANFENVTFEYYSETLGRTIVPNAEEFNKLKLENVQLMKGWLPYLEELEEGGIDKAVCLMIEVEYSDNQILNGESDNAISSENIGGHSISYGSAQKTKLEELNTVSTMQKKYDKAKLFCHFFIGVK